MEQLSQVIKPALFGACYVAVVYLLLYANKVLSDWYAHTKGYDADNAIEEESNLAVALRRAGLYLGIMLGMYGVISGPSRGLLLDLWDIASYGAIVSVFFVFARGFNDLVVLGSMSNTDEVKNGNVAVGLVECGALIATGVVAMASMQGQGGSYMTAIAFFIIGQLALLAVTVVYEWVTPWSVSDEIKAGNPAAGLKLGSLMVAVAIATSGAVAVDFTSWGENLTILVVDGGMAVFFMMVLSYVIDRFFLPGTNIETEIVRDRNVAALTVVAALQIAGAFVIAAAVV